MNTGLLKHFHWQINKWACNSGKLSEANKETKIQNLVACGLVYDTSMDMLAHCYQDYEILAGHLPNKKI